MRGGQHVQGQCFRRDSRGRYAAHSAELRSWRGCWWRIARARTEWVGVLRGGNPAPPSSSPRRPKLIGFISRNICCGSSFGWRGDWVGIQTGPTYGLTLCTAVYRTQSWYCIRVTYINSGNPRVTCLCCISPSMFSTSQYPFFSKGKKGSGASWRRRRHRRRQIWWL